MTFLSFTMNERSSYQEWPKKQSKAKNSAWNLVVGFFLVCLCFGLISFYWAHHREWVRRNLKLSQTPANTFPPGFLIGCASSAYQIEGAWNAEGKGENIWDVLVHKVPSLITNNDTGDVACDSYHKYKEDVQLIKDIGFTHYRFSISWSRVMPTGHDDVINKQGLEYYHNLIDELIANGIVPMVTLYHWDLPQPLQELGGWANPIMADYFETYARVIFDEFAPKVKWWITINEPRKIIKGYAYMEFQEPIAPMVKQAGVADYLTLHTLLRAHAKAYRLYDRVFRPTYGGKISITLDCQFYEPESDSKEDQQAAMTALAFEVDLFAHPIFSRGGDYPKTVRERVKHVSQLEGRSASRLPSFTAAEVEEIRGSFDFFGMNHYTTFLATTGFQPGLLQDAGVKLSSDPSWVTGTPNWLKVVPWGFRKMLNYIKLKYNNPPVFITENGYASDSGLEDHDRIQYYHDYIEQMLLAMYQDECNLIGYTAWSILDNFEWAQGYSQRFGLHFVDFNDPEKKRTTKLSAGYFKKLLDTTRLPEIEKNITDPYTIVTTDANNIETLKSSK